MIITREIENSTKLLESVLKNLDITETQYNSAVTSYKSVAEWLADEKSSLSEFNPDVLPQGSFLLGTIIKPILENDELDVDLVCRLNGKKETWTQYHLKNIVGDRLKEHKTYREMIDEEGGRCWTLNYSEDSKYHMDILPSIATRNYNDSLKKFFDKDIISNYDEIAIRITDKDSINYETETNIENWNKSNPFGYAAWFQLRCVTQSSSKKFLNEAIKPLPKFQPNKTTLQRVVQILKRHRDIMFQGDENKPISIIITTLASKSYNKEDNLAHAIISVLSKMESFIKEVYSEEHNKTIKWIENPVNFEENFADKWPKERIKETNFYKWLNKAKVDFSLYNFQKGTKELKETFSPILGDGVVSKSYESFRDNSIFKSSASILTAKVNDSLNTELPKKLPKPKREGFQ